MCQHPYSVRLKDRVAHSYYKYGRFCASHPFVNLVWSIFAILLLSHPLINVLLSESSFSVYDITSVNVEPAVFQSSWSESDYKKLHGVTFIVQIMFQLKLNCSRDNRQNALKAALFETFKPLLGAPYTNLHLSCFKFSGLAGQGSCLHFVPAALWSYNVTTFLSDRNMQDKYSETVYGRLKLSSLAFGIPMDLTGVSGRSELKTPSKEIRFALTLFLDHLEPGLWSTIGQAFAAQGYEASLRPGQNDSALREPPGRLFLVRFQARQILEYALLGLSYVVLFIYIYFSVSKIEMVKSKWGLAFSAVFTVISSLFMAAGICLQFNLTPRLWSVELFPYIAMLVGLENVLCITGSVVSIPVHFDVKSRLAHGLSKQGWSLTKNFLTSVFILFAGYLTLVPEIQEFCTFGLIGVVTDFYMQLFFYFPILTFDMTLLRKRLSKAPEERNLHLLKQMVMSPVDLESYPAVTCPILDWVPSLASVFRVNAPCTEAQSAKQRLARFHSEPALDEDPDGKHAHFVPGSKAQEGDGHFKKSHRKSASNAAPVSVNMEKVPANSAGSRAPRRWQLLFWWTQNRLLTRLLMALFCLWVVWLAVIVHQLKQVNSAAQYSLAETQAHLLHRLHHSVDVASHQPEKPPELPPLPDASEVAKILTPWWPVVWDMNGDTLTGSRVAFLPYFAVFNKTLSDADVFALMEAERQVSTIIPELQKPDASSKSSTIFSGKLPFSTDLKLRLSRLEIQITVVLIVSWCVFAIVAGFLVYVFYDSAKGTPDSNVTGDTVESNGLSGKDVSNRKGSHRRVGSKAIVESVPIILRGHKAPIECLSVGGNGFVATSCIENSLRIFDSKTGDCLLHAEPGSDVQPPEQRGTDVWTAEHVGVRKRNYGGWAETPSNGTAGIPFPLGFDYSPSIWSLCADNALVVAGFSNGQINIYNMSTGRLCRSVAGFGLAPQGGILHICMQNYRLAAVKVQGKLDFIELMPRQASNESLSHRITRSLTAHQHPVTVLKCTARIVVTASTDKTLKTFDFHTGNYLHTLYGHNGPVLCVVLDEAIHCGYSSCREGLLCVWDLMAGTLLSTIQQHEGVHALALAATRILSLTNDGTLNVWNRDSCALESKLKSKFLTQCRRGPIRTEPLPPAVLTESVVVTSDLSQCKLYFWDLQYKVLLREVTLPEAECPVSHLSVVDSSSVACAADNLAYRINLPIIRLK